MNDNLSPSKSGMVIENSFQVFQAFQPFQSKMSLNKKNNPLSTSSNNKKRSLSSSSSDFNSSPIFPDAHHFTSATSSVSNSNQGGYLPTSSSSSSSSFAPPQLQQLSQQSQQLSMTTAFLPQPMGIPSPSSSTSSISSQMQAMSNDNPSVSHHSHQIHAPIPQHPLTGSSSNPNLSANVPPLSSNPLSILASQTISVSSLPTQTRNSPELSQNQSVSSKTSSQNPESTQNGEGLIAFVPRVDRHQPDFDLIHSQEGDVARLDIKNRKFPKLIFSVTDYETANISGFSTSLSSRKGVAILKKKKASEHFNLYCEVVISGYDLEEKKSDHWVWSGTSTERFPCKMNATIFNFKEDIAEPQFMKRQFEIQIHCHYHMSEYFWRGKLVFSPSNSRGDWGIAIDPTSSHVDLKYQGLIGVNDPLNFYHPQIYIKEGVGLVTDLPPSRETANSLISLSAPPRIAQMNEYKWTMQPTEGNPGVTITIEAEGFGLVPPFRNDIYEIHFREFLQDGTIVVLGKSIVKAKSLCKIVCIAPNCKPGTQAQVSIFDISIGQELFDQPLVFTYVNQEELNRLSLSFLVNSHQGKKKKQDN